LHNLQVPVRLDDGRKGTVELVVQEPKMPKINKKALEEACIKVLERHLNRHHPTMCKGEFNKTSLAAVPRDELLSLSQKVGQMVDAMQRDPTRLIDRRQIRVKYDEEPPARGRSMVPSETAAGQPM